MLDKNRIRFYYSPKVNVIIFLAKQLRPTKKKYIYIYILCNSVSSFKNLGQHEECQIVFSP